MKQLLCRIGLLASAVISPCMAESTVTLSLDQAIERALQVDPRISEKQHFVSKAEALLSEAKSYGDVSADVTFLVGITNGLDEGGFFEADGKTPRRGRYDFDGTSLLTVLQFSVIKPLYTFGKLENYSLAAKNNIEVKAGDVQIQRNATVLDVKRAYYGYLSASDSRKILESVDKRLASAIDLVSEWLEEGEGDVSQSNLYALQAGRAVLGRYMAQATGLERVALAGLKMLVGIEDSVDVELLDKAIKPVELPELTKEDLRKNALSQRPEIAQVNAGLAARQALLEAKKSEKRPNVFAGFLGMAANSTNRDRLDSPFIADPFNDYGIIPVIGLNWKWANGVQSAKIRQAEAELNAMLSKAKFAKTGIPFQVAEQYYQVHAYHEAVNKLAEGSRAARRWMVASFADFEAGLEKPEQIILALQSYVMAHTDYLKTTFDYNMYVAQLMNVTGEKQ